MNAHFRNSTADHAGANFTKSAPVWLIDMWFVAHKADLVVAGGQYIWPTYPTDFQHHPCQ